MRFIQRRLCFVYQLCCVFFVLLLCVFQGEVLKAGHPRRFVGEFSRFPHVYQKAIRHEISCFAPSAFRAFPLTNVQRAPTKAIRLFHERSFSRHNYADPTGDQVFKYLLGHPEHKDILINFLNNVLQHSEDEKIVDVQLKKAESDNRGRDYKIFKMDLLCEDAQKNQYIVEMEKDITKNQRRPVFLNRMQFYAAATYAEQLSSKETYDALKPVICIVLTGTKLFKDDKIARPLSIHEISERESHKVYLKNLRWVFIELPKFKEEETGLKAELDEWLYFFSKGYKLGRLPEVCSPTLEKAYHIIDKSTWTEEQNLAYRQWQIQQADEHEKRVVDRERGRKEGRKEGREEERQKNAQELQESIQRLAYNLRDNPNAVSILQDTFKLSEKEAHAALKQVEDEQKQEA